MKKKKNKSIEMKIYEMLGIKKFKKFVLFLNELGVYPFTKHMTKEERRAMLWNSGGNYNLGKVNSVEDVKKFKKQLLFNTGIHVAGLLICVYPTVGIITGEAALATDIIVPPLIALNSYCIMLQRYNDIRINRFIKKMEPRSKNEKDEVSDELIKADSLIPEHTYKIINKKEKETDITLDEVIDNSNIEQLKIYRQYLESFRRGNEPIYGEDHYYEDSVSIPMKRHKTLKLELKDNRKDY
ncbi:MAG: hypothetical protein IJF92_03670 [Bacilli bacterium]|nr:hypothetical protein [Bacilli bacterium]